MSSLSRGCAGSHSQQAMSLEIVDHSCNSWQGGVQSAPQGLNCGFVNKPMRLARCMAEAKGRGSCRRARRESAAAWAMSATHLLGFQVLEMHCWIVDMHFLST